MIFVFFYVCFGVGGELVGFYRGDYWIFFFYELVNICILWKELGWLFIYFRMEYFEEGVF